MQYFCNIIVRLHIDDIYANTYVYEYNRRFRIKYRNKFFALNILYIFVHYVHPMHFRALKLPINA